MKQFFADRLNQVAPASQPTIWVAIAIDTDLSRHSGVVFQGMLAKQGFRPIEEFLWKTASLFHYRFAGTPLPDDG